MAKTLEQVLGYVYLCGIVEDVKTGIPDVLPPKFWANKKGTLGDQGRYTRYAGTRQTARRVEYGAPSMRRALSAVGVFDIKLMHFFEHLTLDVKLYQSLRGYDNYQPQNFGQQEVDRQAVQFRRLFDNTRLSALYSMFALGYIYFDGNGNLLPTSSGAVVTVDYGIAAANRTTLLDVASATIITASWATASTDIPLHIRKIKETSVRRTGHPLKYALYGRNIPTYFASNTQVKEFFYRNPRMQDHFLTTGELPDGLFGLSWIPVQEGAFFSDQDATIQNWWDADQVTFIPEPEEMLFHWMEGTYPVPTSFQPMASLQAAKESFELKQGMFAYGVPTSNPMTAELHHGDTFLPVWTTPDAMFIADTTP